MSEKCPLCKGNDVKISSTDEKKDGRVVFNTRYACGECGYIWDE